MAQVEEGMVEMSRQWSPIAESLTLFCPYSLIVHPDFLIYIRTLESRVVVDTLIDVHLSYPFTNDKRPVPCPKLKESRPTNAPPRKSY